MSLNRIFVELAETPGKNDKLAILRREKDNKLLQDVIRLALSPMVQFYIRKIPAYTPAKKGVPLSDAIARLQILSSRVVTGNAAISFLQQTLEALSADDAQVIERIIKKDLRCGVATSPNKIWPGLIPEYPCMLATAFSEKLVAKIQFPAYAQLKADGMRFNAIVRKDTVEYRSRNGKELDLLGALDADFIAMAKPFKDREVVFDGELLVKVNGKVAERQIGNGILSKAQKGTLSASEAKLVHAMVWDCIPLADFDKGKWNTPYKERFVMLRSCVQGKVELIENKVVKDLAEAEQVFADYLAQGLEGIILKDPRMPWEDTRSKQQIKFKAEQECDLEVTDWVEGRKGTKYEGMLGALTCQTRDGKLVVNVGGGLNDNLRKTLKPKDVVGKIVSVMYNMKIVDGNGNHSLFLPRFIEIRDDKDEADSLNEVK